MLRFALIGLVGTAISYSVFAVLLKGFGVSPVVASAVGYLTGVGVGYAGNRLWTYGSTARPQGELLAYLLVYLATLGLTVGLMAVLTGPVGLDPLLANGLCIVVTTVANFLATKFLVFRK